MLLWSGLFKKEPNKNENFPGLWPPFFDVLGSRPEGVIEFWITGKKVSFKNIEKK